MKKKGKKNDVVLYQTKQGAIEFRGDFNKDTVWATQQQVVDTFSVQKAAISKHVSNIFKSGELEKIQLFPNWKQFSLKADVR